MGPDRDALARVESGSPEMGTARSVFFGSPPAQEVEGANGEPVMKTSFFDTSQRANALAQKAAAE